jgi:hypothetical protein
MSRTALQRQANARISVRAAIVSINAVDTIPVAVWESCDTTRVLDPWNVHAGVQFEEMLRFEQEFHMLGRHAKDKKVGGYDHELFERTYTGQSSGRGI